MARTMTLVTVGSECRAGDRHSSATAIDAAFVAKSEVAGLVYQPADLGERQPPPLCDGAGSTGDWKRSGQSGRSLRPSGVAGACCEDGVRSA